MRARHAATLLALALAVRASAARADLLDRLSLTGELGVDGIPGGPDAQRFGLGAHALARLGVQLACPLALQATAGNWWFDAREGPVGRLISLEGGLRFAPRVSSRRPALGGPVLDAGAGLGLTGELQRLVLDVGAGWQFWPTRSLGVGPVLRYERIVQPDDQAVPDDASLVSVGLELTLALAPRHDAATATNGAAARDEDRDGVPDARDRCPDQPEDVDGYQDDDGCPDPDNDGDGIPDARDVCPDQAELRNGFQDDDGCPDAPPPVAPPGETAPPPREPTFVIAQSVPFDLGSAHLHSRYGATLDEVVATLLSHPELTRVRVAGHADEQGTPEGNQELSTIRAATVARYLVHHGVAPERIESTGFGATRPLCTEPDEACHARNRRVDFQVLEQR